MTDKISEVPRQTAVKSESPCYDQAKQIVDDLALHSAATINDYPRSINTVIESLESHAPAKS